MSQFISVKKERQQTNKHALLAIMLCLLLLFSLFNFNYSYAVDTLFTVPSVSSTSYSETLTTIRYNDEYLLVNSSADAVYLYGAVPSYTDNGATIYSGFISGRIYFASLTEPASNNAVIYTRNNNNNYGTGNFTYDETYEVYYYQGSQFTLTSSSPTPTYTDLNEFLEAVQNSSGGGSWSGAATVSVEAGCVAYILVDGGTATLITTFPELSKLSRPLWTSGSTYSFENDLPSSGKVFSSTSGTLIDWLIPASAKTDLLGRSYQGGRPLSNLPSGQYLVVYNPVYRGYDDKGVGIMSPTIYVSLSNYGAVRQFRLTASYNGGLIESTSDDGYSSWFDSIGEEELDVNGNPIYIEHLANGTTQTAISIPSGGGNIVINGDNADNSIGGLLERLLSLLTAPIKYIERLYNSAIQFFDYLSSLWGWLPVEVTSIIGAALAVLVVIGVVKFLWK